MPTLLSVDIWDTLIRRRCHPEEVKLFTARSLAATHRSVLRPRFQRPWALLDERVRCEVSIAEEREATGLDNEYAIEEVLERWLGRVLLPRVGPAQRAALVERLVETEVTQEQRVVYADEKMVRLLRHHGADRVVGLSDFYLGERHLRRIIEHACGGSPFERVFVSADCLVNKMRGRLFAHAQRETGADPMHHTHIGDNEWSDVKSPKRFGVRGVHYLDEGEERKRAAHRARFEARRKGAFFATAQILTRRLDATCSPPAELDTRQRRLFETGYRAAPIYVALVLAAMREAHRQGCPAVHYCTREGEFFLRVHRAVASAHPFGPVSPRGVLLEVSRVCTFLPSLRQVSTKEMMRVWNLYREQSMGQMLRTLDLSSFPFEPLLARHGIDPDEVIYHPWEDARVQRLFADPLFVRLIEQHRDRRREVARKYLRSKGLGPGPAVMVDIGWRGTIQDNLAHLLPGCQLSGWYLGLVRTLNEQPPNAVKHAVGPDARTDPELLTQIIHNCSPLEMLSNTDTGSVRGYERGRDGSVQAVRVHDDREDAVWREHTRFFQQGVIAAAPVVAEWTRSFAVEPEEMKPMVVDLLRTIKAAPPRVLAEAYFSLRHNETFGVGGFVDKRAQLAPGLLRKGEESGGSDPEFVRAIEATDWPQGLLRLLGRDELCRQYNSFREDRARRIDARRARRAARGANQSPTPVVKAGVGGTMTNGHAKPTSQPGTLPVASGESK